MKNKAKIDIIIPCLEKRYNILVPISKTVIELAYLLSNAINELTGGNFPLTEDICLIDGFTGKMLNSQLTLAENKITNGSRIIIIRR